MTSICTIHLQKYWLSMGERQSPYFVGSTKGIVRIGLDVDSRISDVEGPGLNRPIGLIGQGVEESGSTKARWTRGVARWRVLVGDRLDLVYHKASQFITLLDRRNFAEPQCPNKSVERPIMGLERMHIAEGGSNYERQI